MFFRPYDPERMKALNVGAKAKQQRIEMMAGKLYDQMARGFIGNQWAEDFIESTYMRVRAGLPLTDKQEAKLEELFERY